jgi:hypothetical protein
VDAASEGKAMSSGPESIHRGGEWSSHPVCPFCGTYAFAASPYAEALAHVNACPENKVARDLETRVQQFEVQVDVLKGAIEGYQAAEDRKRYRYPWW